ncbi:hypothetical protein GCM10010988_41620 [Cnuibacter physcomitrellae]|uniref:hypothetical protein n=1 Tax=Cnuibacter physcomitrellae TaxID=1619308 RepID=UPI0012F521D0|nr:hypothetical protein [Cnuibacter physcomitrellae]GGI42954.1 hypothetical protein GCM10010988_41620 [Cnuibacter physcomitrellae]
MRWPWQRRRPPRLPSPAPPDDPYRAYLVWVEAGKPAMQWPIVASAPADDDAPEDPVGGTGQYRP